MVYDTSGLLLSTIKYNGDVRSKSINYYPNGTIRSITTHKLSGVDKHVGFDCDGKKYAWSKSKMVCDGSPYPDCNQVTLSSKVKRSSCLDILTDSLWSYDSTFYFKTPFQWATYGIVSRTFAISNDKSLSTFEIYVYPDSALKTKLERYVDYDYTSKSTFESENMLYHVYEFNKVNTGLQKGNQKRKEIHILWKQENHTFMAKCSVPRGKVSWYRSTMELMARSLVVEK